MDGPSTPRPANFGLTEADYDRVHRLRFPDEEIADDAPRFLHALRPERLVVLSGALGALLSFVTIWPYGTLSALIGGLFVSCVMGALSALGGVIVVGVIVRPAYLAAAALTVPGFTKYLAFQRAMAHYALKRKEYDQWRLRTAIEFWCSLSGKQFEREVAGLYGRLGYEVALTPGTADGGVDIVLRRGDEVTAVQCKAYRGKVGVSVGRELVTAARDLGATRMMIACTTGASPPLHAYASEKGIQIVNAEGLVKMQAVLDGMPIAHLTLERPQDIAARLRALQQSRERKRG